MMNNILLIARLIYKIINKAEKFLLVSIGSLATIFVCIDVFYRYVLNQPFLITEELVRMGQIFIAYIGLGAVIRSRKHISLDILSNLHFMAKEDNQRRLRIFTELIGLMFCSVLVWLSYNYLILGFSAGKLSASNLPLAIPYSFLLIGFVLASLNHGINIFSNIHNKRGG